MGPDDATLILDKTAEDRFARFRAIKWWDQSLLRKARVLVVGAGALGNEVDQEPRAAGRGQPDHRGHGPRRAEQPEPLGALPRRRTRAGPRRCGGAGGAADLPRHHAHRRCTGNVAERRRPGLLSLGPGRGRGAGQPRGAASSSTAPAASVGTPWIDGGIDVLNGIVRGFAPPASACYECTMGQADWDLLAKRRSCSLLARRATAEGGTPTTPTTASVVGAIQAQEVVKHSTGSKRCAAAASSSKASRTTRSPWATRDRPTARGTKNRRRFSTTPTFGSRHAAAGAGTDAPRALGGLDAIDLSRELIDTLDCPACGALAAAAQGGGVGDARTRPCARLRGASACRIFSQPPCRLAAAGADRRRELGLPPWDIVWARRGTRMLGIEMTADRDACLLPKESLVPTETTQERAR